MSSFSSRNNLVEKSGILHIYYANKTFKHWKKRWLHLQDQQLSIYQGKVFKTSHATQSDQIVFADAHLKRLENLLNIKDYRVSITNSDDSISHKGYTFKVITQRSLVNIVIET